MKRITLLSFIGIAGFLVFGGFTQDKDKSPDKSLPCIVIDNACMTINGHNVLSKAFYHNNVANAVDSGFFYDAWNDSIFSMTFGQPDSSFTEQVLSDAHDTLNKFWDVKTWKLLDMEVSHLDPSEKNIEMVSFRFIIPEQSAICLKVDGFRIIRETTALEMNAYFKEKGMITQSGNDVSYSMETKTLYPLPSPGYSLFFKYDNGGRKIREFNITIML